MTATTFLAHRRAVSAVASIGLAITLVSPAGAQNRKHPNYFQDDFPFQGACISAKFPDHNIAYKGLAIRVGHGASMLFDEELVRMAAGWTGGYITGHGVVYDGNHGVHPQIDGDQKFGTASIPGWADADAGFVDNRPEKPYGPLPDNQAKWNGLYVHGMEVVLSYTIQGVDIYEQPGSTEADGEIGFVRTFKIDGRVSKPLLLNIAEVPDARVEIVDKSASLIAGDQITKVAVIGAADDARLEVRDEQVLLEIPPGRESKPFKVVIWSGNPSNQSKFAKLSAGDPEMVDFKKGGPQRWTESVTVKGELATSKTPDDAFETDSITTPSKNPWNRRVRLGGMAFFSDGKRAALSTHEGDIWIVSGIDDKLDHLTWTRFASGMYETLGLAIVDDVIYTSGRDQITRYHDLNGDGEADFYECFNNQYVSSQGFHEFVFDLQTDAAGNFYFAKAGPVRAGGPGFGDRDGKTPGNGEITSFSGTLMKVSKDGKKLEIIATGFRAPNGIGVRPDGQVTTSDNEGTWVPTTPINWIQHGGFYGVTHQDDDRRTGPLKDFYPPLCWLAKDYDNSGGGQIWIHDSEMGPLDGRLLHMSYGQSSLYLVMMEPVGHDRIAMQGGVVKIPVKFDSSAMRARINPRDKQLYIAGLREWQSNAAHETGFDRIRYTGKKWHSANSLKVVHGGVEIGFSQPLSKDSAEDLQNWSGKRWNYHRTSTYGSPEFLVNQPEKQGREPIEIISAKLAADGKTVTLQIKDFKPVMQETIRYLLDAADGELLDQEIMHTVHVIP